MNPVVIGNATLYLGDCREILPTLADASVNCCVTSPPYFGLRDYGHAGQIGLEQTPEDYVAKLVEVFREVRRVLRNDGTLWLNLGDTYATDGGPGWQGKNGQRSDRRFTGTRNTVPMREQSRTAFAGHKPKDLLGIPWRVAFALQQPYYAGRIKRELDRMWLAAMVDGEGCFYVHRRPAGQHAGGGYFRTQDSYSPAFEVANTHKAIIDRCMEIVGCGSVICQEKDRRQPLWRWTVRANEAREIAREIYPYLVGKQQQCRIICGMPASGDKAEAAWQAMKLLHGGKDSTVDFSAPESLHQPGYYLRQDLIWSKPNPMPESVRDRCTKAHEYIFLLSKSERYYFDARAIAEPLAPSSIERLSQVTLDHQRGSDRVPGKTNGNMKAVGPRFGGSKYGDNQSTEARTKSGNEYTGDEAGLRNKRSVWTVSTQPFKDAHFATFPPALIEPCILAGCPEGGTVLDPFGGAGTTGLVADRLHRKAILIELNQQYADMARERIRADAPLFAGAAA